MGILKKNILNILNRIFRIKITPSLSNINHQNYLEYKTTYDTLSKLFNNIGDMDVYLIGGISAAIQTNQDLYRQNGDIDIMCKEEELPKLIEILQKTGYKVGDRRGIKTRNTVDLNGNFHPMDHELNADTKNSKMLGVGIFTYQIKGNKVITHSYAFDEREGKVIGTEKVMKKELFDLMYDRKIIDYKGIKLKTQSKEYIFMSKSKGTRPKDKMDRAIIEPILDDVSRSKINRMRELDAETISYKLVYDENGKAFSKIKLPTLKEKVFDYMDNLFMQDTTKNPQEIARGIFQSEEYERVISSHPEIKSLIEKWIEKSKDYTYQDKISLLTIEYSNQLNKYSKEAIDNAIDFLQTRKDNNGQTDNDVELSNEAKEIFDLMKEYGQAIKRVFIDNNISITHITSIAPEKLENAKIRKSTNKANNYETEIVDGVFASSSPVDGNNPYIARNKSGMVSLGKTTYIYGSDNIKVISDENGKKHAMLRKPNFIYYLNPEKFIPVCNLAINRYNNKPTFEFSEEWISDTEIDISDHKQVMKIDKIEDITRLLENFTVLCDVNSQEIGMKVRNLETKEEAIRLVGECIKNGFLRNINEEAGINTRESITQGE